MLNTNRGLAGAIAAILGVLGLAALTTQGVPTEVVLAGMGIVGTLGGATVIRNRDGGGDAVAGIGAVVSYLDDVEERLQRAVEKEPETATQTPDAGRGL